MNTNSWISCVVKETESALTLLYSYMGFFDALKDPEVVKAANKNSQFWRTYTASTQQALFLYLGRLSDNGKDCKSFSAFNNHCVVNVSDFSKDDFLTRKTEVLKMNPNYLDNSEFPTKEDICNLFSIAKKYNAFFRAECKTIRNKVYAHAILTEEHEYFHLFEKVEFTEIESGLLAYWSVSQHLWQSFHNARTIMPELLTFQEKEKIYKSVAMAIKGAI
jgi:hypothetical protein